MSTADFLFSGNAPSVWTSPTWTNTSAPDWWQAAAQGMIGKASSIAGQPYQAYAGPRIADFSPLQKQALESATTYQPSVADKFSSANQNISSGGNLFNPSELESFKNPYTEGVVNRIAELGKRNLEENLLPSVNDTFIKAGQFGSSRNQDFTLRALRDANESILGQQANTLQSSQDAAMRNLAEAKSRQLQSGQSMAAMAGQQGDEARRQLEQTMKLGTAQQALPQANLDLAYQDFLKQQQYPLQQLQTLDASLRGFTPSNSVTQYGSSPTMGTASPLANISATLNSWGRNQ